MKTNKINFYNELIYSETLDNGLEIVILPNKNIEDTFVTFTARYGGCNFRFKLNNKYMKVPNGIAHFLEHKMFEQKDGMDPFSFYNLNGTYCNAFTNYYNTSYIFAGNKNFDENLTYLLNFVQSPYFTDENVEKEKGIITQELMMYDDMPDNIIFEKTIFNVFNKHPIKYSVGGTVEDIVKITKEDLYNCYKTFYNPKNMFIIITGNVDPSHAIDLIKNNQKYKKFENINIMLEEIDEDDSVSVKSQIIKHNVTIPYVAYAIKIPISEYKIERKKLNLYLSNIMNILFDETSLLYENLKNNGLLETPIDIDTIDTDKHKVFILSFKSNEYKKIIEEIDKTLENIKIPQEDLERKKKVNISNILFMFDDISNTNKMILNNMILYNNVFTNIYDIIKDMNIKELEEILTKINLKNKSLLVIENQE